MALAISSKDRYYKILYGLKTVKLNPYHVEALNDLGANYIEVGQLNNAVAAYEKLIKIAPDFFKAYNNLGMIYYRQKNYDKAKEMFKEALRINPNDKFSIHWIETIESQ